MALCSHEGNRLKRLYKSYRQRQLAGVCGGVAEYFGVDPTIVRVFWLLTSFLGGTGVIVYVAAILVVPRDPNEPVPTPGVASESSRLLIWGLGLAAFGALLFLHNLGWLFPLGFWGLLSATGNLLVPILFVLIGAILIVAAKRGGEEGVKSLLREQRLQRSGSDKVVGGVCAGVASYFHIDPSLARLLWVTGSLLSLGAGVLVYLVLLLVVPVADEEPHRAPPGRAAERSESPGDPIGSVGALAPSPEAGGKRD